MVLVASAIEVQNSMPFGSVRFSIDFSSGMVLFRYSEFASLLGYWGLV